MGRGSARVSENAGEHCAEGGFRRDSSNTTQAGLVPVLCLTKGASTTTSLQYPVYRPSRHPPDDSTTDEQATVFFDDISLRMKQSESCIS